MVVPNDQLATFLLEEFAKDLAKRLGADFTCAEARHYQDREEEWFSTKSNPDIEIAEVKFPNFCVMAFVVPTDFDFAAGPPRLGSGRITCFRQGDVVCKVHNGRDLDRYCKVGHIADPNIYQAIYDFTAARVCGV